MPDYDVQFYDIDPFGGFSQTAGGTAAYGGPAQPDGRATITDNVDGVLEDDNAGEAATATITVGGSTVSGAVRAEEVWTLRDTVTGETFEVVSLTITTGGSTSYYTLSERPLVQGRSYETIEFDSLPDAGAGDPVFTYADYSGFPDGIVEGTAGDDVIDANYTGDPEGEVVDGNDAATTAPPEPQQLNWTDYADNTDLRGGVTQDTGGIDVTLSYTGPSGGTLRAEHSNPLYVAGGEPFNANSGLRLFQDGDAQDAAITFDFAAQSGSGFEDEVENVSFRISDIDGLVDGTNNFEDIVTITAFDADGNAVPVTITPSGNVTVAGNVATGQLINTNEGAAQGSVLVEIAGPVASLTVNYDNGGDTQQAIFLTDLHFDAIPVGSNDDVIQAGAGNDIVDAGYGDDQIFGEAGDDTLTGASGADSLDGGTGNDSITVGAGDTALGGDGDDTFILTGDAPAGSTITITGGEGDETGGDTLDFNGQLAPGTIVYTNTDDAAGGLSGTATLIDGTTVSFSEIENIICFGSGSLIDTPRGPRPVETLRPGDLVLTADHGARPIRWHGRRTVPARGKFAPVRIAAGILGVTADLIVSPQHRMLIRDYRAQVYFGEEEVLVPAKSLAGSLGVETLEGGTVTYHHLLFDAHEIVFANGAPSESYHPGEHSLAGIAAPAREELFAVFPGLRGGVDSYGPTARPSIRPAKARLLAA